MSPAHTYVSEPNTLSITYYAIEHSTQEINQIAHHVKYSVYI